LHVLSAYGYDLDDEETSVTDANEFETTYSYNSLGDVVGESEPVTVKEGMVFSTEESPVATYTYDADGNMITSTNTSTHDVWTYTYNFLNLMTGAVEKTSTGTILAQVTYTYDARDNRIGMDENGTQTWTLYDGSDPIMDFNSSSSLITPIIIS
jgi:YD repeat-containing protein